MAVKRYMTNDTAAVSLPTAAGSWDVNTNGHNALASAIGAGAGAASSGAESSATNPTTSLARRFVDSTQMLSAGDFGGAWSMVVAANESNAAADAYIRVVIKVLDSTGATIRGSQAFVHGSELTTTNTAYTVSGSISPPISCSVGDRISVEVGGNFINAVATAYQVNIRRGGTAGDLVSGDTGSNANDRSGYITFSDATADARFTSGATGDVAASIPLQTTSLGATLCDIATIATFTDSATGGGEVEVSVPSVAVGDALLIIAGNAYTDPATGTPAVDVAGSVAAIGTAWIGDPEIPTYYNQNLGTWLFTATGSGTATVDLTVANETVFTVVHLRPRSGYVVTVADVSEHLAAQGGGGPDAAQAIGAVDGILDGLLVGIWAGIRFSAYTWSTPTGMTELAAVQDGSSTQSMMVAEQVLAATADTGTRTSTATLAPSNGFAGKLISLTIGTAGITGDVAGSIPLQAAAIAGDLPLTGALAASIPLQTSAVAGDVTDPVITGALAGSIPLQTGAVAGSVVIAGDVASSIPLPTVAIAGDLPLTGALAGSIPLQALIVETDGTTSGTVAGSIPLQVAALAGELPLTGALAGSVPLATVAIAADIADVTITGALAGAIPMPSLELLQRLQLALPLRTGTPVLEGDLGPGTPVLELGTRSGTPTVELGLKTGTPA